MLSLLIASQVPALRILFVGNSLLNYNDGPAIVAHLLESDGAKRKVAFQARFVGHLEDVPPGASVDREVASGDYNVVVLQAAMVSSSMTRNYSQARGIAMAKAAKARGSRVLLFVEWPRRGVNETEYTLNVYRGIARASGAEILPVCHAWNLLFKKSPEAPIWSSDGNHALPSGTFLASCAVYFRLAGTDRTPTYRPEGISPSFANLALSCAREVEAGASK